MAPLLVLCFTLSAAFGQSTGRDVERLTQELAAQQQLISELAGESARLADKSIGLQVERAAEAQLESLEREIELTRTQTMLQEARARRLVLDDRIRQAEATGMDLVTLDELVPARDRALADERALESQYWALRLQSGFESRMESGGAEIARVQTEELRQTTDHQYQEALNRYRDLQRQLDEARAQMARPEPTPAPSPTPTPAPTP